MIIQELFRDQDYLLSTYSWYDRIIVEQRNPSIDSTRLVGCDQYHYVIQDIIDVIDCSQKILVVGEHLSYTFFAPLYKAISVAGWTFVLVDCYAWLSGSRKKIDQWAEGIIQIADIMPVWEPLNESMLHDILLNQQGHRYVRLIDTVYPDQLDYTYTKDFPWVISWLLGRQSSHQEIEVMIITWWAFLQSAIAIVSALDQLAISSEFFCLYHYMQWINVSLLAPHARFFMLIYDGNDADVMIAYLWLDPKKTLIVTPAVNDVTTFLDEYKREQMRYDHHFCIDRIYELLKK